jgi:aldose 1-epimerase
MPYSNTVKQSLYGGNMRKQFNTEHIHPFQIVLQHGDFEVGLLPHCGGSISYFGERVEGAFRHWLRPMVPGGLDRSCGEFSAMFPLVPFSGRIAGGIFSFKGVEYDVGTTESEPNALHGDGWINRWNVEEQTEKSVKLVLENPDSRWPWTYRSEQAIELTDSGLSVTISYINLADEDVPVGIGLHPWFLPGAELQTEYNTAWMTDDSHLFASKIDVPEKWDFSIFKPVADSRCVNGFTGWNHLARLRWPERDKELELTASDTLKHLVLYSQHPSGSFCLEPVTHSVDSFNLENQGVAGNGTVVLRTKESLQGTVSLKVVHP